MSKQNGDKSGLHSGTGMMIGGHWRFLLYAFVEAKGRIEGMICKPHIEKRLGIALHIKGEMVLHVKKGMVLPVKREGVLHVKRGMVLSVEEGMVVKSELVIVVQIVRVCEKRSFAKCMKNGAKSGARRRQRKKEGTEGRS